MHMAQAHLSGNTSGVLKSLSDCLNYTGFSGDVCVRFFNVLPGNKHAVVPNPLAQKKKVVFTTVTTSTYQCQLNSGFKKVCEIFKVSGIESLKYSSTHRFVIVMTFPHPETWCWTKQILIGSLICRSNGLMVEPWPMNVAIYSAQTDGWRSGYAKLRVCLNQLPCSVVRALIRESAILRAVSIVKSFQCTERSLPWKVPQWPTKTREHRHSLCAPLP